MQVDKRLIAAIFAIVAGASVSLVMRQAPALYATIAVAVAAVISSLLGWNLASRWNVSCAVAEVMEMGGVDALLDRFGRESLTVWIPLDHSLSEADRTFARQLGAELNNHVSKRVASFVAIETGYSSHTNTDAVGVVVVGRHADVMLESVRPFFKQRCPKNAYVTRYHCCRDNELFDHTIHTWPEPKPLFESDDDSAPCA